jgi:hypothetical protein
MKRMAMIMLALCSLSVQAAPAKKTAKTPAPARKAAAAPRKAAPAPAVVIPANATRVDENTYTHTDAHGKTWMYRQTPFGIQKSEQTAESKPYALPEAVRERESPFSAEGTSPAAGSGNAAAEDLSATESGDLVTFRRKTPFGNNTWTKKKSELTAEERALLERANSR